MAVDRERAPRRDLPLVELLHAASRHASAHFEARLNHPTLTARQAAALLVLAAHPGFNQRELAHLLAMDRSSLSVMLRRMENNDLIARTHEDGDARAWIVAPTKRGTALLARIRAAEETTVADMRAHIGEAAMVSLRNILLRILRDATT